MSKLYSIPGVFLCLLLVVCSVSRTQGQTFFPVGGPLLERQISYDQANLCFLYFNNPSGDSLRLRWRRLDMSLPQGWDADLCDYGLCYFGVPNTGLMNYVYDTIQPWLKLVVDPGAAPGSAWFWFRVSEEGNPANFQDVYFSLYTPGFTAAPSAVDQAGIRVFPNPVSDFLTLENNQNRSFVATLYDTQGRAASRFDVAAQGQTQLDLRHLPPGFYRLYTGFSIHNVFIQK